MFTYSADEYEGYGYACGGSIPLKKDGKWGAVDYENKVIVPFEYDGYEAGPDYQGNFDGPYYRIEYHNRDGSLLAFAKVWGEMNPIIYTGFYDGICFIDCYENVMGTIDLQGNITWRDNPGYDEEEARNGVISTMRVTK